LRGRGDYLCRDGKIYIRVPHWADKKDAGLEINDVKSKILWEAEFSYIITNVKSGDIIRVTWPLVEFTHISQVWPDSAPDLKVVSDWLGNNVIECRPSAGENKIALFRSKPRIIPKLYLN